MKKQTFINDVFGGLAAMLVAFPSAVAFGILVYAPLGSSYAAMGAMSGIIGAIAIGIIAPAFGGAPRLVSAPCAPAAAVLAALAVQLMKGTSAPAPELIMLLVTVVAIMAGALQLVFGFLGGGKLIKYIPYPVVAGYLSGVGILIFLGQCPKLLGLPKGVSLLYGIISPGMWNIPGLAIGLVTIAVMLLSARVTRAIPAPIIALSGGILAYFGFSILYPEMATLAGNPLVIGEIGASSTSFIQGFADRWNSFKLLTGENLALVITPALTLAVLLSIDTLKTCVVLDALTRSRHNSNRELIGQGLGNLASAVMGGMSGAGTMGATLVNISSGGHSRLSGVLTGVFALAAFLLLAKFIAWIPIAALAGILIVVAFRMIDKHSFRLLKQRSTVVDFVVIAAVVLTAVTLSLIAAAGVGLGMAILLFMRDQIRGSVVRRKTFGNQVFSKKRRLPVEMAVLEEKGGQTVVFELQGALFFGTTDQLFNEIEPHLKDSKYVILDMRRIRSVDFTATHLLEQLEARVSERGGSLIFTNLPRNLPTGQNLRAYFDHVGLVHPKRGIKLFPDLDSALEWVEEEILTKDAASSPQNEVPLNLQEINVFSGLSPGIIEKLGLCSHERSYSTGEKIFTQGDKGDELFLIRKGAVRIVLPLHNREGHHLATFARGDFFGDMAFLDQNTRSADAVAAAETHLFVVSREEFNKVARTYPELGSEVFAHVARVLALRLRHTDTELRALEDL